MGLRHSNMLERGKAKSKACRRPRRHGRGVQMIPVLLNAACAATAFLTLGLWSAAAAAAAGVAAAFQALSLLVA